MAAKWSPKGAQGHLLGSVKTMAAGIVREAYGEVSGRVGEATFSRLPLQTLFGSFLGSIFEDFRRFWVSFGRLGGSFWVPEGSGNRRMAIQLGGNVLETFWKGFGTVLETVWSSFCHNFVIILPYFCDRLVPFASWQTCICGAIWPLLSTRGALLSTGGAPPAQKQKAYIHTYIHTHT